MRSTTLVFALTLLLAGCSSTRPVAQPQPADIPSQAHIDPDNRTPFVVNTRLGFTEWTHLTPWNEAITHLRIPGGSVSQYTWSSWEHVPTWIQNDQRKRRHQTILDDEMMDAYLNFIKDKNIQNYWVININDKLEHQTDLLDRFIAKGLEVTHIELGNETYLPKYTRNRKEALGFTHNITVDDYIALMDTWLPALRDKYEAELLVVLASRSFDGRGGDQRRATWNDKVTAWAEANANLVDGYVVHVYTGSDKSGGGEEESSSSDFKYMDAFKKPIHITEAGNNDANWSEAGIEAYKQFQRALLAYLESRNDGSHFGAHVLYNPRFVANHPHAMYTPQGITPIGVAAMEFPHRKP